VISPLLGNIYLHYVLDLWAERWRRNEATGDMIIVRYADDVVVGFEREADANRFLEAIAHAVRGVCSVAPSGQDSPDRVRPPCRGQTQTRNLYLVLASPSSAVNHAAANSYSKGRAGAAACRPSWRRSRRNCDTAGTSQSPNRGSGWRTSLPGSSTTMRCRRTLRHSRHPATMSGIFGNARSSGEVRGTTRPTVDEEAGQRLASKTAYPSSVATRPLRRQTPEVGAGCVMWRR
jgi:hypothetical protein